MDKAIPENSLTTRAELSNRIYVAESAIHGKGIMARRAYVPGDYIGTYWGIYVEEPTPYTLMVEDESEFVRHVEGRNALRYINHADEQNCEFDGIHLFARGRYSGMKSLLLIIGVRDKLMPYFVSWLNYSPYIP